MTTKRPGLPLFSLSRYALPLLAALFVASTTQTNARNDDRKITFPDIPGYRTLKCDFHIHTVFSDGHVWPGVRVAEAIKEGLDAIAITDHVENQAHRDDLATQDMNRGYLIAREAAKGKDILVVRGGEVGFGMPPGHLNALFVRDVNRLRSEHRRDNPLAAFREAAAQGAFVLWNHPMWLYHNPDGVARLTEMHEQMLKGNLFQGIEVVNAVAYTSGTQTYSEEALQIALDHNLTIMGNSDIHNPSDPAYAGQHRPVTLVFAKDKDEASLKEALLDRRTAVWFKNTLIGRRQWIDPLLAACLTATSARYAVARKGVKSTVLDIDLHNASDADFILRNVGPLKLHNFADVLIVPRHGSVTVAVRTLQHLAEVVMQFEVMNAVTAPGTHAVVSLTVRPEAL